MQDAAASGGLDPRGPARPRIPRTASPCSSAPTTPFGNTLGRTTGWVHRAELARNGVKMLKGVAYRRIDDAGVHIAVEGKESVIPADYVVICAGQEPLRPLPAKHLIGGAQGSGRARREARDAAKARSSAPLSRHERRDARRLRRI